MSIILVLNAGSSSVKFSLYQNSSILIRGQIGGLPEQPELSMALRHQAPSTTSLPELSSLEDAVGYVLDACMDELSGTRPDAVGHRVVHGGAHFAGPREITPEVRMHLEKLIPLAPLHQPVALNAIDAVEERLPGVVQSASFDTSFHRSQAAHVQLYALPQDYRDRGIQRYGFHGLSYEHVAIEASRLMPDVSEPRIVAAHLGSGASLCAIRGQTSVATSMGFSALEGLPMATRCGSLDPGAVLYLIRHEGVPPETVERALYAEAGLKGLSGLGTGDIRSLLAKRGGPDVKRALQHFVHRIRLGIGEMAAALGGVDALVFTGGIGENAAWVREEVVSGLRFLGFSLDAHRNTEHNKRISPDQSEKPVFVVKADEESIIKRDAEQVLAAHR